LRTRSGGNTIRYDRAFLQAGRPELHPDQSAKWRICFRWTTAAPEDFEIVDYH
jgi:hypothetical protein